MFSTSFTTSLLSPRLSVNRGGLAFKAQPCTCPSTRTHTHIRTWVSIYPQKAAVTSAPAGETRFGAGRSWRLLPLAPALRFPLATPLRGLRKPTEKVSSLFPVPASARPPSPAAAASARPPGPARPVGGAPPCQCPVCGGARRGEWLGPGSPNRGPGGCWRPAAGRRGGGGGAGGPRQP